MTTEPVTLRTVVPVVAVKDFETAMAFYKDRLGFDVLFEQGRYGGVRRGDVELHIDGASGRGVGTATVRIHVEGVDVLFAEMDEKDVVDPDEPLNTKAWGFRQFSVLDCCGSRITFIQEA